MSESTKVPGWDIEGILRQLEEKYKAESIPAAWESEADGLKAALKAMQNEISGRYSPTRVLGVGGSGIVLRLKDDLFAGLDKALKFPRPVQGRIQLVREMLEKEVRTLAEIRHPGVVRILHYGAVAGVQAYDKLPYYIMECIDGTKSATFARSPATTEAAFHNLVVGASETLVHIHSCSLKGFVHLDLKPDNIMVTADGRPIIIDLGTCKRRGDEGGFTMVACSLPYAHPQVAQRLAKDPTDDNRVRGEIERANLDPRWDLWSFGLTLLEWLGVDRETGAVAADAIYNRIRPYARKYYMLLIARLLSYSMKSWIPKRVGLSDAFIKAFPIESASDLHKILVRLNSSDGPMESVAEFRGRSYGSLQAAPGLHAPLTPALAAVLNHRLCQRLNSITQLGLVCQVYPSAKHTRREHILGTYANIRRMFSALYDDEYCPLFRQVLTEEDCRTVLLAALLHDIGQFPLAHDLEEIDDRVFDHSELTRAILKGEWDKKKKGSKRVIFDSLTPVFDAWKVKPDRLLAILMAGAKNTGATAKDKLLRSVLSGPIDSDKLDYLFRDARSTDVPYPFGVDLDMLYRCVTTVVVEKITGVGKDIPAIGIHAKGRVAAEFLTMARYAMFSQVYWHHATRVQKAMLCRAVAALLAQMTSDEQIEEFKSDFVAMVMGLPESLYVRPGQQLIPGIEEEKSLSFGVTRFKTGLPPTDAAVLAWLREKLVGASRPEAFLLENILERRFFKRLWVVSYDMESDLWERIVRLFDQLDRVKRHRASLALEVEIAKKNLVGITTMKAEEAKGKIQEYTAAERPWLLLDIPGARTGSDVGLHYVLEGQRRRLKKDDRTVGDLQLSQAWEQYAGDLRKAAGKIRIFCDPELADAVEASVTPDVAMEALEECLNREVS